MSKHQHSEAKHGERHHPVPDLLRMDDSLRAYATLIGQLRQAAQHGEHIRSVGILSCHPQDGSAQVCRHLAECAAMIVGEDVLLVDTRTTHIAKPVRSGQIRLGHAEFLAGQVALDDCLRTSTTPKLWLLPASPARMTAAAYDPAMLEQAVQRWQDRFELTFVDLGSLSTAGNCGLLAARLDGVILVLAPHRTRTSEAKRCKQELQRLGVSILGAVIAEPR